MKIEWTVKSQQPMTLKSFLKTKNISKRLLAKVKFQGGRLEVNHQLSRVRKTVLQGDLISLTIPIETGSDVLEISHKKIDVLFEDDHFLIVNKPSSIPSVPSSIYRNHTMANRVKGYIEKNNYKHKTIHIVTRLDKDTTGVMIFAKHSLAHSYLDQLLQEKNLYKEYVAFAEGVIEKPSGLINMPIGRMEDSIIKRQIDDMGKPSLTEYWVKQRYTDATKVKVQLHTGRTHQIRVHFAALNHALLGDTLYNSKANNDLIERQALHCAKVSFKHPFTDSQLTVEAPLSEDLILLTNQLESMRRD
ncbi:RluA family pseudouridine synthase [Alkalibacterium sp. f15]|uniref:RluA family pseudouridine synthase n=1 Tax=Alkalibacterium sp. f15 TaxID=3414029 RepID=UPI003BF8B246